jgi:subtilisin family serine protease
MTEKPTGPSSATTCSRTLMSRRLPRRPLPAGRSARCASSPLGTLLCAECLCALLVIAGAVRLAGRTPVQAAPRTDRVGLLVELVDPPVADVVARGGAGSGAAAGADRLETAPVGLLRGPGLEPTADEARPSGAGPAALARLRARQAILIPRIEALGGRVIDSFQRLFDGLWVTVPRSSRAALRALPGVKALHHVGYAHLENIASVPFIGAPQVWNGLRDQGEGIRIAIVDTGIDYTHRNFGGPGTPSAYANNNGTTIEPGTFPTAKVIGGYDFAGDNYHPDPNNPDSAAPTPDPDPLDQQGHGSHVAGTAAGFGVPGKIGAGVAPRALLYAYKVFSTDPYTPDPVVLAGMERAVDPNGDGDLTDHADVINLSLADDYGLATDPLSVASDRAVSVGAIVVAAAGNAGNRPYITGTPATANDVISVGASLDSTQGARADQLAAFSSRGPRRGDARLKPDLVAPGYAIPSTRVGSGDGAMFLSGTSMATPHVSGVAALLRRLHPDWSVGEIKAVLMNTAGPTFQDGAGGTLPYAISLQGAGRVRADVAAQTLSVAISEAGTPNLSFGFLPLVSAQRVTRAITVRNKGDAAREFSLSASFLLPTSQETGVQLTLDPPTLAVPAGGEGSARLTVDVDPLLLRGGPNPVEYDGFVTLVETTGTRETLRLPFHLIPHAVAHTTAAIDDDNRTVRLTGDGARPSVAEVFTLAVEDPADSAGDADIRAVGVRARGSTAADRVIEFAIATYRPWTTSSGDVLAFAFDIDANRDGQPDYRVETSASVVTLVNLATNRSQVSQTPAEIDYNHSVMRVSVKAADVGLSGGGPFDFFTSSSSLYGDDDSTFRASFDPSRPAFKLSATHLEFRGSATLTVGVDAAARAAMPSRGLLLLYPEDTPGLGQAQVVRVP